MIPVLSSAARDPPPVTRAPPQPPASFPLESLPDDLGINCIARVSSPDLAALPLVSKRYRSLVSSSEFKKLRSRLGCTEERLYVCLKNHCNPNHLWYVIHRQTLSSVNGLVMSPIPSWPSPRRGSAVVVLGWGIYMIGGYLNGQGTSDVWLLDCRTNTWRIVPSMRTPRSGAVAGVVDGKIYVFGGDRKDSLIWGEVFDPKTQTWDALGAMPDRGQVDDEFRLHSMVMGEKVYGVNLTKGSLVYYAPSEGKWGREIRRDLIEIDDHQLCLILCGCGENLGNLLYGYDVILGELFWRETDEKDWKRVKGLERRFMGDHKWIHTLGNIGLNVVFIWFENKNESVEIWCCEISLKRVEEKGEVWGTIEWLGVVGSLYDMLYRDPFGGVLYSASVNV